MPETQRDTVSIQAIELPAAYSHGGHVQLRTIIQPAGDQTPRSPDEVNIPVLLGDPRQK